MLRMIPIITICHRMTESIDEEEKLVHQIYGAGQRREYIMLTEDEKVLNNIYTLGGMQECLMMMKNKHYL